ncbi:sensor histidine kinase [Luteococcus peritonei]|uniref:Sensor histidine kinase n=1 Tax=Luteococcus peritonei TaxID=88874 RepID=A0ABW4RSS3_9ACTN
MSPLPTGPEHAAEGLPSPWSRYGWLFAAVWLVFLTGPLISAVQAPHAPWQRAVTVALVVSFGAAFTVGMDRQWGSGREGRLDPVSGAWLAGLLLLSLATVPVIGLDALAMTPFLASFAIYTLPLQAGLPLALALLPAAVGLPLARGQFGNWSFFGIVLVSVISISTLSRVVGDKDAKYSQARDALQLARERDRVARDVHDLLGHSLTLVVVKTEVAERMLDADPQRARTELAEIRSLARSALVEVRETVVGLRVPTLADELASARSALDGAGITGDLPEDPAVVDPRHRTVIAWALREAVTNVVRHSGAGHCVVVLGPSSLVVGDDGGGMRGREGNGLSGLRQRVEAAAGRLTIDAGPEGRGTRLEVQL